MGASSEEGRGKRESVGEEKGANLLKSASKKTPQHKGREKERNGLRE